MKVTVAAIGKIGNAQPQGQMIADYAKRLPWPLTIKEGDAKKGLKGDKLQAAEGDMLLGWCPKGSFKIALDERGKMLSSREFARKLQWIQEEGFQDVSFLIGGADGHNAELRQQCDMLWSLGDMVWPHKLVRVMVMEQLYRAHTIQTGHPYHRD